MPEKYEELEPFGWTFATEKAPQPGRQSALKASPGFNQRKRKQWYLHKGIPAICGLNYVQGPGHAFSSDNDGEVCEAVPELTGIHLEKQSQKPDQFQVDEEDPANKACLRKRQTAWPAAFTGGLMSQLEIS